MKLKRIWKIIIVLIILFVVSIISLTAVYNYELSCVDKNDKVDVIFTIEKGTSTKTIAKNLSDAKLIHSDKFLIIYLKLHKINNLQASTYKLNRSMNVKQIIKKIQNGDGYNPDEITITFKEGKNMRYIATEISKKTNNKYEDVLKKVNDKTYIDSLIEKYWFLTKNIKNSDIYYPLEGYLFPNTYKFKNKDVTIEEIFSKMLDESVKVLNEYKSDIEKSKYTTHQLITLASIIELEGANSKDRPTISSVFYNRLDRGISLGSDVTACYAQKIDDTALCHRTANFNYNSKYNTRLLRNTGIPVGAICNPSKSSIEAAINPEKTDYLYFVADKNTKMYFFKTEREFSNKIKELKQKGLWL